MDRTLQVPLFALDDATGMLAMALALHAFRNPLEDLHSGTFPSSQTGDYSDVKVVSPYGEIPWISLSRISDEEMKVLMIEVVQTLFTLLIGLEDKNVQVAIVASAFDDIVKWDRVTIDEGLWKSIQRPPKSTNPAVIAAIRKILAQGRTDRQKAHTAADR